MLSIVKQQVEWIKFLLRNCESAWVVFVLFSFILILRSLFQVADPPSLILEDFQSWRLRVQSSSFPFHVYISIPFNCSYIELFIVAGMASMGSFFAPLLVLSWRTIIFISFLDSSRSYTLPTIHIKWYQELEGSTLPWRSSSPPMDLFFKTGFETHPWCKLWILE